MEENKIIIPSRVSKDFIQCHRQWIFLFGCTVYGSIYFGQAAQCLGEPNCFGIPTKVRACMSNPDAFFSDCPPLYIAEINAAFDKIPQDDRPIIPLRKIGMGCAELHIRAPQTLAYIQQRIKKIAYPNIETDWNY